MVRRDLIAVVVSLGCCLGAALWSKQQLQSDAISHADPVQMVSDASGHRVPAGKYLRIAALSTIACQVLPELIALERVVLISEWHQKISPQSFKTKGIPTIASAKDVEALLAARPDIVFINGFQMQDDVIHQLREAGLQVFDLGKLDGPPSLFPAIEAMGQVLQAFQRAQRLSKSLQYRLAKVAAHLGADERRTALYLERYGDSLGGGTEGSSFYHLLRLAGLNDVAAGQGLQPWPTHRVEQILRWNPDYVITSEGSAALIQQVPGMDRLKARYIELPKGFDSTGPELLDHVEAIYQRVYEVGVNSPP